MQHDFAIALIVLCSFCDGLRISQLSVQTETSPGFLFHESEDNSPSAQISFSKMLNDQPANCETHAKKILANIEHFMTENQTALVHNAFSNPKHESKLKFLIISTAKEVCFVDNWFTHALSSQPTPSLFVHAALDMKSHRACVDNMQSRAGKHTIDCLDLSDVVAASLMEEEAHSDFKSCLYQIIVWMKPLLFKVATSATVPRTVVLTDLDVLLHGDIQKLLDMDTTSTLQTGNEGFELPNTGFLQVNVHDPDLFKYWLAKAPESMHHGSTGDQAALHLLLVGKDNKKGEGIYLVKDSRRYRNKKDLKNAVHLIPKNLVGMKGIVGEFATHYNDSGGFVGNKITMMKKNFQWKPQSQQCQNQKR